MTEKLRRLIAQANQSKADSKEYGPTGTEDDTFAHDEALLINLVNKHFTDVFSSDIPDDFDYDNYTIPKSKWVQEDSDD